MPQAEERSRRALVAVPARPEIDTLVDLRTHLQWAIELEHATIPPYLCALYTLDADVNGEAAEIIYSVLLEEMLHLVLAANVLNAVGGCPVLDAPHLLPGHPRELPHHSPALVVSLLPFGPDALRQILHVEQPCAPDAPAQPDRYSTIGQFYDAIRVGLVGLTEAEGEETVFCGDPARQVADREFRGGPGRIFKVTGLATALAAIDLIVEQGEGAGRVDVWDGDPDMFHRDRAAVGHFYRVQQLLAGRRFAPGDTPHDSPTGPLVHVDWSAVHPMRANPRCADFPPGTPVREAMDDFNDTYCSMLARLERTLDGNPAMLGAAVGTMFELKQRAADLVRTPVGTSETAGPSFEYVRPEDRRRPASIADA